MSFADMPPTPPLALPGGPEYATRVLELSRRAVARGRTLLDVPVGDDYWQKIDLFFPADSALTDLPVLLFVHGGAWSKGYKEWMGFMAPPINAFPAIFISVGHRLAPAARFPKPAEDCLAALAWTHANIARFGGSPQRIFIGGHSSGGQLAALVALRRDWATARGLPADIVKGCFPVSAPLNVSIEDSSGRRLDIIRQFLERDSDDAEANPIHHTKGNRIPFILCYGSRDLPEISVHNRLMRKNLEREAGPVQELLLEGFDHFDTSLAAADPTSDWVTAVRTIMQQSIDEK